VCARIACASTEGNCDSGICFGAAGVFEHAKHIATSATAKRVFIACDYRGVDERAGAIRLQKIISHAGIASRRAAEKLIAEGRVTVNGETVREMGTKADPSRDDIRIDGRRIKGAERLRYILLYKPAGYVTTRSDPERRPTVIDLLRGVKEYVYPVGRLDYDTEGLLLLTNDGELAARLTHPRHGVERTYEARVAGMPDDAAIERLRRGIPLDGRRTLPADVSLLNKRRGASDGVLAITIREGRNRQVRRMLEAVGHPVKKLTRVGVGPLSDRGLKPGTWRELTPQELRVLKRDAFHSPPARET
jgi:23S rRNA pseudouridine2605 synthase